MRPLVLLVFRSRLLSVHQVFNLCWEVNLIIVSDESNHHGVICKLYGLGKLVWLLSWSRPAAQSPQSATGQ